MIMLNIALFMSAEQLPLKFRKHGGARKNAGRKPWKVSRPNVPHRERPRHSRAHPVHVTLRARGGLPTLRQAGIVREIREAIRGANRSPAVGDAFRVVEFSIQADHAHFIIEARDNDVLSRGLRGLAIRFARAVNRAIGIRGAVWGDRYHARELKTPRHVRNAIVYVLMNAKKHGVPITTGVDLFSSAPWFEARCARRTRGLAARATSRSERLAHRDDVVVRRLLVPSHEMLAALLGNDRRLVVRSGERLHVVE
jgi:putative transposase